MLQIFRDKAQSIVIQAIVVIIALVFVFWGVGTNLNNSQEAAIVVNDEEISFQQYQQAYDRTYAAFAQQFGGTIPKELAQSLNIKQQVISQLTREALLRQGGLDMGLAVSSDEIQEEIESMVQFQNNGSFDLERYKAVLAANRLSPKKFENSLRYDLLSNKTISRIGDFALEASPYEIEELYTLENESIRLDYVVISPDSYQQDQEINDADLAAWYESAGTRYQTEPMVKLRYLPYRYDDVASRVTVEESDIAAYYDENLPQYQIPEKRRARHILFKASPEDPGEIHKRQRRRAEEVLERARSGDDFAALAREFSEGPTGPTGGDLGYFQRGQMVAPFDEAVFKLEPGEFSGVVQTDFGYHLIKLEEIQPAEVKALAQVRDEIAASLKREQAKPLAFQLANTDYEAIIGAGSLDAFLQQQPETRIVETGFFGRSNPPEGIPAEPLFLERALALKEGELSSIIETPEGYAIISAIERKEPEIPPLDSVREQALADYREELAATQAKAAAEALLEEVRGGTPLAEAAGKIGLRVQDSGLLAKNDDSRQSDFPEQLRQQAFRLSVSEPLPEEPALVGSDFYVFRFVERIPPEKPLSEEDRQRYSELLLQFKQQQLIEAWLANQQAQAKVFVHQSLQQQ